MFRRRNQDSSDDSSVGENGSVIGEAQSNYQIGGPRRGAGFRIWPLLIFGLFAVGYYFTHQETVPLTGRKQVVGMSPEQETALGIQSYREVLSDSKIAATGPEVQLVRSVGERIARVTEAPDLPWEFNVIVDDTVNAFCLPGGKVAVYSGILPVAENASGLATVMGHEIAHAIARHGAERMAHGQLLQFGQMALGMATGEMNNEKRRAIMGAFGVGAQFGAMLPFSRKHESEADYLGLIYMARACFDPLEAPKFWRRMQQSHQNSPRQPEFMSTHPNDDRRIEQLEAWIPKALEEREIHCGHG